MTSPRVLEALRRGVELHRAGRIEDAERAYIEALALDKTNADALNLLGVVVQARGKRAEALGYFDQAIAAAPRFAPALFNRANLLAEMERLEDAQSDYQRALALNPGYVEARLNLGVLLFRRGRRDEALRHFQEMIAQAPQDARGFYNLGRCHLDAGDAARARDALEQAVSLAPASFDSLVALSRSYERLQRLDLAIAVLKRALAINGKDGELWSLLGNWLAATRDWAASFAAHETARAHDRRRPEFAYNQANAYYAAGRFKEAEGLFRETIGLAPEFTSAHVNLGQLLADMGDDDAAMAIFDRAMALAPDRPEAADNKAAVLTNKALTLLAAGRYEEGWAAYRRRFDHRSISAARRKFNLPEWAGEAMPAGTLLLWTDQGLGDEIMYASMVPEAAGRVGQCILECEPRLVPVFAASFPGIEVVPRQDPPASRVAALASARQRSVADLGGLFRTSRSAFPRHGGYLRANAARTVALTQRYRNLANGRPIIGISWRSKSERFGDFKSLPLDRWSRLLSVDALYVSLQYGDVNDDIAYIKQTHGVDVVHDIDIDAMRDLESFAAQVAVMDLVVSVSNTTVHFAGALNKDVWTLVPAGKGALWYFRSGESSPWYPSMRIFRQAHAGDWSGVVESASDALTRWRGEWRP